MKKVTAAQARKQKATYAQRVADTRALIAGRKTKRQPPQAKNVWARLYKFGETVKWWTATDVQQRKKHAALFEMMQTLPGTVSEGPHFVFRNDGSELRILREYGGLDPSLMTEEEARVRRLRGYR